MNARHKLLQLGFIVSVTTLICSCAVLSPTSDPSRFYKLSSNARQQAPLSYNNSNMIIMPVVLPTYLDRPQIIQETGKHELVFSEYDRWGEPLSEGTTRTIHDNLASLLGATHIRQFPYSGERTLQRNFYLRTSISSFEADSLEHVNLKVSWRITDYRDVKIFTFGESHFEKKTDTKDYNRLVSAMSELLMNLSLEIAKAALALEPETATR